MCWLSKEVIPFNIAAEDVEVYKVMFATESDRRLMSCYRRMLYDAGKEYEVEMTVSKLDKGILGKYHMMIEQGFHSYSLDNTIVMRNVTNLSVICKETGDCIESVKLLSLIKRVAVKCIIPKGSKYYKNDLGEIVSDQIIITGEAIAFD